MSYWLASLRLGVALAVLAAGTPWLCTVQAQSRQRGKTIEFSNPKGNVGTNNLNPLTSRKDSLRQLEEDLNKQGRPFSDASSLDAVAPPLERPYVPAIPSKRLKEEMDRRKNVFLLTPEDLVHEPTLQELLKVPEYGSDGREKESKKSFELWYERQDATHAAALKGHLLHGDEKSHDATDGSRGQDTGRTADDLTLPSALDAKEQALRNLFDSDHSENPFAPAGPKAGSSSDIFGLGQATPTKEQVLERKKYMQEFSAILDGTSRALPATADPAKPSGNGTDPSRKLPNPFGVNDSALPGSGALGFINPLMIPTGPPDVNAQTLGQSALAPKLAVPKGPVAPTFSAPQRPPM
jgi:hypothetical protein